MLLRKLFGQLKLLFLRNLRRKGDKTMRCKFPPNDLSARLDSSICRYKGRPVFIRFDGGNSLRLYSVKDANKSGKSLGIIDAGDEFLDVSTVPLGYMQVGDGVVYLTRRPVRRFKQGVDGESLSPKFIPGSPVINTGYHIFSPSFEDMVLDNYPPLEVTLERFRTATVDLEIAVSRDIALRYHHKVRVTFVYFKGEEVGVIPPDSQTVMVPKSDNAWIISKYLSRFQWKVS